MVCSYNFYSNVYMMASQARVIVNVSKLLTLIVI